MPVIARSAASIRIFADDLVLEEITTRLGRAPTKARCKGDLRHRPTGAPVVQKTGMCLYDAADAEPGDLNAQVMSLLTELTPNLDAWRDLTAVYRVDVYCGIFMEGFGEGFCLEASTMTALAERGLRVQIELYAPVLRVDDPCPCEGGVPYGECCGSAVPTPKAT